MTTHQLVLGIRREDKNRWERRAPVAPTHVKELVQKGIKVLVQPSSLRTFSDRQYAEVR
jgi:alpha-aminoadipic semialdehyde synthase